ncbi:MAG TPA: hypothetical protein VNU68_16790 [Verrucomicrobiae bacterium]|nr:hypothetical protein [Verrucomicrobiae bacterium]
MIKCFPDNRPAPAIPGPAFFVLYPASAGKSGGCKFVNNRYLTTPNTVSIFHGSFEANKLCTSINSTLYGEIEGEAVRPQTAA